MTSQELAERLDAILAEAKRAQAEYDAHAVAGAMQLDDSSTRACEPAIGTSTPTARRRRALVAADDAFMQWLKANDIVPIYRIHQ